MSIELDQEERYGLTAWGCLASVLTDYNINIDHITPKMSDHIMMDFMEAMVRAGHVKRNEENETNR